MGDPNPNERPDEPEEEEKSKDLNAIREQYDGLVKDHSLFSIVDKERITPPFGGSKNPYIEPPEGYNIGDAYLKLRLANEAKALEGRVNKYGTDEKGLRKKKEALQFALSPKHTSGISFLLKRVFVGSEDYEARLNQSGADFNEYSERMKDVSKAIERMEAEHAELVEGSDDEESQESQHRKNMKVGAVVEMDAELGRARQYFSGCQKKCFNAYTTMHVLTAYAERIMQELEIIDSRVCAGEFRLLRDSDQLV